MKPWKLVTLAFAYAVVAGLIIGWQLPQPAYAYPVCSDPQCQNGLHCQVDICCVTQGCGTGEVKRHLRGYSNQYCAYRCVIAQGCFATCYPS